MSYPVLLGAIVITSANRGIRINEGGTLATALLATGTYYLRGDGAAGDFLPALVTALEAATASVNTYSATVTRSIDTATAHTLVTITRTSGGNDWQILWADALTTFDETLLGFTANTALGATPKVSTQACAAGWVSNDILRELEPFGDRVAEVTRRSNGGTIGVSMSSHMTSWALGFAFVNEARMLLRRDLACAGDTLEGFVQRFGAGAAFECHEVPISSGTTLAGATSSTLVAVMHWSQETVTSFRPRRIGPGVPLYDLDTVAHEQVTA
jgi:hypothetical protein